MRYYRSIAPLSNKQIHELQTFIRTAETKAEALRAQAILLTDRRGGSGDLQPLTGYSRSHALSLKKRYRTEGISALTDKRKGKPKELLTKKQRDAVLLALQTKTPKELGYAHDHWTTGLLYHPQQTPRKDYPPSLIL